MYAFRTRTDCTAPGSILKMCEEKKKLHTVFDMQLIIERKSSELRFAGLLLKLFYVRRKKGHGERPLNLRAHDEIIAITAMMISSTRDGPSLRL